MDSLELEDSGEHQPSLEVSLASDVIYDDAPVCPCIGSEHQAEIPTLSTEGERQQLMTSSLGSVLPGFDYPVTIGLAIPVMWEPSVALKGEELERHHSSESEARAIGQDEDSRVTSVCATSNDMSDHDSTYQDPHPVVPLDHIDSGSNLAHDENLTLCSTQEGLSFTNKPMTQQGEVDQFTPLPCASTSFWSGIEAECFLLGLYIFGKNLSLLSRFVGNKTIGDMLSYYYGKFYKRDAYRRWADCRKARTRRCILGERIFTSWRQQEIISRLKSILVDEAHDSLAEIFKSFNDGQTSLEDFAFALKSTVGTEAFVEAVGIGKEKHDLTGFVVDPSKPNQVLSHPDMPTGKDCSSLASEDIIKFLTGDFRRSKTRSNDLFWEAVWPRLLARGWRSEQPKDVSTTKNSLVFLVPGIKKFSRSKLTKGTHYFDSVSDVLKRVAADPILLDMEVGGMSNDVTAEQNGYDTDMKLSQDDPLDGNQELPRFTIIDTTLVRGEEPFRVRELRGLPADAKVRSVPSRHSRKIVSVSSSSEELDADGRLSDDQEYHGQVTADVNDTEILSVYNVKKETQVDSLQNMVTASCSDFPVNGHSSNDSGNKIDLTSLFEPKTKKAERRKYLSPVSKRRRLSSCNNDQTSRRSIPFSKGIGSAKEKIKPLSTSSKPIVGDVCGKYKIKAVGRCSTEKPCEQITDASASASNTLNNDRSNEKMGVKKLNEDKSFERKVMPEVHSKITAPETKFAKGAQVSSLVGQVKQEKPLDGMTDAIVCVTLSDDDDYMMAEEAPSISNSHQVHEPEVTERPASSQSDLASQAENSRRHGTRNRPPTAKALEALALGLLGGKRKGEPKSPGPSRPPQRAHKTRKSSKGSVRTPTGSDTDKSSMDADAQHHINILDD